MIATIRDKLQARISTLAAASIFFMCSGWAGSASASTFYDWNSSEGGSGFIEFDTTGLDPANFNAVDSLALAPIDFSFDFGLPGLPVIEFSDVAVVTNFAAENGRLVSGLLWETPEYNTATGIDLLVAVHQVTCFGCTSGFSFDVTGTWDLRPVTLVPAPPALLLLITALTGMGAFNRWRRRKPRTEVS